jgi:uncharacterized membrane protein (DUF106 family)
MSLLNGLLRPAFDVLLYPFRDLPPWVGLLVVSLVAAIFVLLVYRRVSNQPAIARVKDQIAASFFEIRLFNDDMRAILRAQGDLLRNNLVYLGLNLVPLVWLIVPFVLAIAQLQFHYGYEGLAPGEPTVLTVDLAQEGDFDAPRPDLRLEAAPGIAVETPGVWIPSRAQMAWRLVPIEASSWELILRHDGEAYTKTVDATAGITRRSPQRLAPAFFDQLLYPAEPPLPADAPFRAIRLDYPEAAVSILGIELHWLIWFFVLSIVVAYALRKRFGVTF